MANEVIQALGAETLLRGVPTRGTPLATFALALLLFDDPRTKRIAAGVTLVLAFLIGISRPMLGVHWPSDVIAGWAFGLFWVALVFSVMKLWKPAAKR